jgi:hypothetical protein
VKSALTQATVRARATVERIASFPSAVATALALMLSLAACTSSVVVSEPGQLRGEPPRGAVRPLADYLRTNDGHAPQVKLVFIHGIGDVCPGYALGDNGWLSGTHLAAIGFAPIGDASPPQRIYSNEFLGGARIDDSYVAVSKRPFLFAPDPKQPAKGVHVEAIEITYSPLTQWLKSQQLGYDLTGAFKPAGDPAFACVADVPPYYAPPPARAGFNAGMKEAVIDRGLADAVLYLGPYGHAMRSGVAEAMCLALSDNRTGGRCAWPAPAPDTRYVFVVHSLGSRLIYDTLLGLLDRDACSGGVDVAAGQERAASRFAASVIANSPVIYMMANQIPLLGLATIPAQAQPQPAGGGQPAGTAGAIGQPFERCGGLRRFASEKAAQQAQASSDAAAQLDIVAFSDTDDVLSWGLPKWYVRELPEPGGQWLNIHAVNVYVQNATRWFGAYENPGVAHVGYFDNPQVWRVVACGARDGKALPC